MNTAGSSVGVGSTLPLSSPPATGSGGICKSLTGRSLSPIAEGGVMIRRSGPRRACYSRTGVGLSEHKSGKSRDGRVFSCEAFVDAVGVGHREFRGRQVDSLRAPEEPRRAGGRR